MGPKLHVVTELPALVAPAAVLVAVYTDDRGDLRTVITKRSETMPTHGGHLSFPGGRPHPGDDGPVSTALREAEEEVGITPGDVDVLGYLAPVDTVQYPRPVVPVVGRLPGEPQLRPDPREVVRVLTPGLVDLADEARWRREPWNGRLLWFTDLDGDVLWGATAAMVRSLLGLLP